MSKALMCHEAEKAKLTPPPHTHLLDPLRHRDDALGASLRHMSNVISWSKDRPYGLRGRLSEQNR